jgi:hypothetical protein
VSICLAFNEHFSGSKDGYGLKSSISVNETIVECVYLDGEECYYNRRVNTLQYSSLVSCTCSLVHF